MMLSEKPKIGVTLMGKISNHVVQSDMIMLRAIILPLIKGDGSTGEKNTKKLIMIRHRKTPWQ